MTRLFAITYIVRGQSPRVGDRVIQRRAETIELVEADVRRELREAFPGPCGDGAYRLRSIVALNTEA